jgi:hypothetical protein
LPPRPRSEGQFLGTRSPETWTIHASGENLPPWTPVIHPSGENLPPGTPVIHPSGENLPPGTPVSAAPFCRLCA